MSSFQLLQELQQIQFTLEEQALLNEGWKSKLAAALLAVTVGITSIAGIKNSVGSDSDHSSRPNITAQSVSDAPTFKKSVGDYSKVKNPRLVIRNDVYQFKKELTSYFAEKAVQEKYQVDLEDLPSQIKASVIRKAEAQADVMIDDLEISLLSSIGLKPGSVSVDDGGQEASSSHRTAQQSHSRRIPDNSW